MIMTLPIDTIGEDDIPLFDAFLTSDVVSEKSF